MGPYREAGLLRGFIRLWTGIWALIERLAFSEVLLGLLHLAGVYITLKQRSVQPRITADASK